MYIPALIQDITTLCDDEAASSSTSHLRNVRGMLEQLASFIARREQAIEARLEGTVQTALEIETRAESLICQLEIDGSAMVRSWDLTAPCSRCDSTE